MKGQCLISCCPLRAKPESSAELLSQILFGETYEVIEDGDDWMRVRLLDDGYEGWISASQHSEPRFESTQLQRLATMITGDSGAIYPMSCYLPSTMASIALFPDLLILTRLFVGSPYMWGGKTFMGIDCSGLVQVVHKCRNIQLPRDASQQVKHGSEVSFGDHHTGDLAFFHNEKMDITHVGIIASENTIIHAAGKVREDKFTAQGITHSENGLHTHKLNCIRRLHV